MFRNILSVRSSFGLRAFSTTGVKQNTPSTFGSALKNPTKVKKAAEEAESQLRRATNTKILKNVLHCNFRKNNTFLTLTRVEVDLNYEAKNPNATFNEKVLYYLTLPQKIVLSQSTGYLGFRKAQRGEYEGTFQLSSHVFKLINEKKALQEGNNLEVIVRGFGKGRKAFFDALKGKEGSGIREYITKFTDLTPIAFGGNRAPARRRI